MVGLFRSRLGIILVSAALLLALDAGRSIWARLALAVPSSEYRPDPTQYADLTWPPGANLGQGASLGARVFAQRCAVCHGPDGKGNGPAAPSMFPRPRDFSSGAFKYKSAAAGEAPTDDDLLRTIRDGLPASAMPYFAGLLSNEELTAVVEQVKSFSMAFSRPGRGIEIPASVPSSPQSVTRGKGLFVGQGCTGCHGDNGRGGQPFDDGSSHRVFARDLTAPWTFRGGNRAVDIWLRLTTGIKPGPMPAYADCCPLTPAGIWRILSSPSRAHRPGKTVAALAARDSPRTLAGAATTLPVGRCAACAIRRSTGPGFITSTEPISLAACALAIIRTVTR